MLTGFFIEIIPAATPANANYTTDFINVLSYSMAAVQFIGASLDTNDGVIKLQDSLDGSNWNDISGMSLTITAGASVNMLRVPNLTGAYLRAVWTKGTNTTGTVTAKIILK